MYVSRALKQPGAAHAREQHPDEAQAHQVRSGELARTMKTKMKRTAMRAERKHNEKDDKNNILTTKLMPLGRLHLPYVWRLMIIKQTVKDSNSP
jgi:hypothetical protein